jgi:cellobiose phosphorylase
MINTDPNGYTFSTNPAYFDILKPWNQQKRMRYTGSRIFMRKTNLGKNSLTIKYAMTRNQISPR